MANVLGELFGDIASAIREKTGDAEKMKPAQFPEKISEIETGADVSGVTATAADVLQGKTIVDADGNEVEGSIPVVETSEVELSVQTPSGAIPVGYYANGVALSVAAKSAAVTPTKETQNLADSFYDSITVDPIPDEYQNVSGVTATAEDVVEGKVIVDAQGNEVVGTLVPGGGGSLPAGVYWESVKYMLPNQGTPIYYFKDNEWYFMLDRVKVGADLYKLVGEDSYELVASNLMYAGSDGTDYIPEMNKCRVFVRNNGNVHFVTPDRARHFVFDGEKLTRLTSPPIIYAERTVYMRDNTLYFYDSNGLLIRYDDATDTWIDTGILTTDTSNKSIALVFEHKGKIYRLDIDGKLYVFVDRVKSLYKDFASELNVDIYTFRAEYDNGLLYFLLKTESSPLYRYDIENDTLTGLGIAPVLQSSDTRMRILDGKVHIIGKYYKNGSIYYDLSNYHVIMREVTE